MSDDHQRIRQIKAHINQLFSELRRIEPNNQSLENLLPFNSSFTTISHEKCLLDNQCPYLSRPQAKFHSTTYHEYKKLQQRKMPCLFSPKKDFLIFACATSTPKHSPNENISLKAHLTSTPRRNKRPSTNLIPLKRLLYNKNQQKKDTNRPHDIRLNDRFSQGVVLYIQLMNINNGFKFRSFSFDLPSNFYFCFSHNQRNKNKLFTS